ncbi:hypothetical protein [Mycolicibacterium sp. CH28]|uniref:hypothetical protein n=1 Tax=Mycolicibacterium sp. CH28 TaxID=2512237 RepID=UPI0010815E3F|nr:hypothetical protein [Mycolicibacterium sp. CH28]
MPRRCRLLVAGVGLATVLAGCGGQDSNAPRASGPVAGPVILNDISVAAVVDAINKAKLPAVNPRDATASTCPAAGCVQATDTDTVSILKFPSTGRAEVYAASMPDMLQVEDIVVIFTPTMTSEQKAAYGRVIKSAVSG